MANKLRDSLRFPLHELRKSGYTASKATESNEFVNRQRVDCNPCLKRNIEQSRGRESLSTVSFLFLTAGSSLLSDLREYHSSPRRYRLIN